MAQIRVLRIMEYTYDSIDVALSDMARWHVQGAHKPNTHTTIKSTTLPMEFLDEPPRTREQIAAFAREWNERVKKGKEVVLTPEEKLANYLEQNIEGIKHLVMAFVEHHRNDGKVAKELGVPMEFSAAGEGHTFLGLDVVYVEMYRGAKYEIRPGGL